MVHASCARLKEGDPVTGSRTTLLTHILEHRRLAETADGLEGHPQDPVDRAVIEGGLHGPDGGKVLPGGASPGDDDHVLVDVAVDSTAVDVADGKVAAAEVTPGPGSTDVVAVLR